jgi:cell division protein FtsL
MNVAVKTITRINILPHIFIQPISIKKHALTIGLAIAILLTAIGIICVQNSNRQLMSELQTLQDNNANLHNKWSQLLLEESTWTSAIRIEQIAHKKLGMQIPKTQFTITT